MFAQSLALSMDNHETLYPLLEVFGRVHLLDSSYLALPEEVASLFPASGGRGPKAGAKIQLMIDYLKGNFSPLGLTDARTPDQKQLFAVHEQIKAGELLIADLGYFSQEGLLPLVDHGAFFLCLLPKKTALYTQTASGEYKRLDLWKVRGPADSTAVKRA